MYSATLQKSNTGFYKLITPIVVSVFAVYLTMGMSLGILPGFIQNDLKFGSLIIGVVIGLQSLATLLTRAYSGKIADTKGAKRSKDTGVLFVLVAGIVYVLAATLHHYTILALALILLSRIIHGVAESMLVTGALTWGIGLVGPERSGKVMTWNGIAMYAGIAIGAPFSIWMTKTYGTVSAFAIIIILSFVSWLATGKLPKLIVATVQVRTPFYKVVKQVAGQGLGLAFSSMAFACIASFVSLFFAEKNWGDASLSFILFGACYILTRVFFAFFPDKYGGYKVALISLIIEVTGQFLMGFSASKANAIIGCSLTGIGFSLIFPSLGVIAIKKVSPQMRGTALGAYAAFFDLALGLAGPLAGLIAGWYNYQAVYILGGISCLLAILIIRNKK
ncbi:MAG: MFS transporter [Niastella sp.]|uniref:MFS transporter n=1 Tax=Niastella sp. TaxID=1869183 RepID=UPI0038999277